MLRYAITNRIHHPGDEHERSAAILEDAVRWIAEGLTYIQLREKDLSAQNQANLARNILKKIALAPSHTQTPTHTQPPTKLLINSRPDIALATRAHGVHLSASPDQLSPTQVRHLYASTGHAPPLITISCHTLAEVERAHHHKVDAILFAPVFEKPLPGDQSLPGQGLDRLRAACLAAAPIPVYALGGVTLQNAPSCLEAGAAGIAGIRLFQPLTTHH